MGYQVGNVCYATKQEADNVYFSLVAPVVVSNGTVSSNQTTMGRPVRLPPSMVNNQATGKVKIVHPEYRNNKWYLSGQQITASLPACDPAKNFKDGLEIGWLVFGVMAACYVFVVIKGLLR